MLKRAFDGALTPMMQFLIEYEGLSKNEAAQLRELIKKSNPSTLLRMGKKPEGRK
jgi:hypothetical protein